MEKLINQRLLHAMVLLLAIRCLGLLAYRAAVAPGDNFLGNFQTFHEAGQRLNSHQPLYNPNAGPNDKPQCVSSPLIPVLMRPLARMPVGTAFKLWAGLNVAMVALAVVLYCWGTGLRLLDAPVPVLLALLTAYRFWPTTLELAVGNSDIMLMVALCALYVCERYGKWILFALVVALAALTKTWMIAALFYLLVRRKWLAAVAGVGFFVAGGAMLFCVVGWKEFHPFLEVTRRFSSQPTIVSHSVAGIARMFFTINPVMTPLVNSSALHLVVLAAGYGILAAGLLYLWWKGPAMNGYQRRLCLGLTALALILGSPLSHQYYFILALPLLWTLMAGDGESTPGWGVRVAAFLLYLILSIPAPGDPLPAVYKHGFKSLEVAITFVTAMSLWGLGLFAMVSKFSRSGNVAAESGRGSVSPDSPFESAGADPAERPGAVIASH
jgi:hypothetical protein